jgi:hypothetical protein
LLKPLIISAARRIEMRNPIKQMINSTLVRKLTISELTLIAPLISTCPGCQGRFPREGAGQGCRALTNQ